MTTIGTAATTQVYQTYIKATPEAVWNGLTTAEQTKAYGYRSPVEYDLEVGGAFRAYPSEEMRSVWIAVWICVSHPRPMSELMRMKTNQNPATIAATVCAVVSPPALAMIEPAVSSARTKNRMLIHKRRAVCRTWRRPADAGAR